MITIRTPDELTRLVAETREPMPCDHISGRGSREWRYSEQHAEWIPVHAYATDIAAAKTLQAEMLAAGCVLSMQASQGCVRLWLFDRDAGDDGVPNWHATASTEAEALCWLWLTWKGVHYCRNPRPQSPEPEPEENER